MELCQTPRLLLKTQTRNSCLQETHLITEVGMASAAKKVIWGDNGCKCKTPQDIKEQRAWEVSEGLPLYWITLVVSPIAPWIPIDSLRLQC